MAGIVLIINYLLLHLRYGAKFILLIAKLWFKACFTDGLLYSISSKTVRSARCTYHVLFNLFTLPQDILSTNLRYESKGQRKYSKSSNHEPILESKICCVIERWASQFVLVLW